MANQFLNAQEYANVMLLLLKNQLVFGRLVDGQFKDQVTDENGLTINVKRPPRFVDSKDGTAALVPQDIVTGTAPVWLKVRVALFVTGPRPSEPEVPPLPICKVPPVMVVQP